MTSFCCGNRNRANGLSVRPVYDETIADENN